MGKKSSGPGRNHAAGVLFFYNDQMLVAMYTREGVYFSHD